MSFRRASEARQEESVVRQQRIRRGRPILAAFPTPEISLALKRQEPALSEAEGVGILTSDPATENRGKSRVAGCPISRIFCEKWGFFPRRSAHLLVRRTACRKTSQPYPPKTPWPDPDMNRYARMGRARSTWHR
jgi:hypothetical protein